MKLILILGLFAISYTTQAQTEKNTPSKDIPTIKVSDKASLPEEMPSTITIEPEHEPLFKDKIPTYISYTEEMPRFPGCENIAGNNADKKSCADQKLLNFIYSNLVYPKNGLNVEGLAVVSFIIKKDGALDDIKILRSLGEPFDVEVIKVMDKMVQEVGFWIPGKQRGQVVDVRYNLPIRFKLN